MSKTDKSASTASPATGSTEAEPTASVAAASKTIPMVPAPLRGTLMTNNPFRWAFIGTLGVMLALLMAMMIQSLQEVLLAVFIAAFIALGLDPTVRFLQRRGMKRSWALLTVILLVVAIVTGIVWVLVPPLVTQAVSVVKNLPNDTLDITKMPWFDAINTATNGLALDLVNSVAKIFADPNTWSNIGGGALKFGLSVANGVTISIFVFVLTIYFIASLDTIKKSMYALVSKSKRDQVVYFGDKILGSIGTYLSGMVILAFINAVWSTILLTLVGVQYAFLLGVMILFITMIPLVGTVITTCIMTIVALFVSPTAAIIVLVAMLVYMQVEAYIFTPRVMSKAVQIPGSVVLISALAGGTLLGLLGALVAIPVSAGILLIIKQVVMPARELS